MTLLNPVALFGLLALLVPLLLHLIQRSDTKEKDWAAMEFLLEKEAYSVKKHSLREWLLLLCRLLLIGFLILALAQPLGRLFSFSSQKPDTIFLLLDRSSGMGEIQPSGKSKMEEALAEVAETLKPYGNEVRLYLMDSATQEFLPVIDTGALSLLSQTQVVDAAADFSRMVEKATQEVTTGDYGNTEVWLITDGKRETWSPESDSWKRLVSGEKAVMLRHIPVRGKVSGDLRLSMTSAVHEADSVTVTLNITGGAPGQRVTLNGKRDDGESFTHQLSLNDGQLSYPLSFPLKGETLSGEISLPEDENPANNTAYFMVGPSKDYTTLVVTEAENSRLTQNLMKTVSLKKFPHQKVKWVTPADFMLTDLTRVDSVLWAAQGSDEARVKVEGFVKSGKVAVLFPDPSLDPHEAGWFFRHLEEAPAEEFFTVSDWNKKEGPWKNSSIGEELPLSYVQAIVYAEVMIPEASPLASWSTGDPLLVRAFLGQGMLYAISTVPHFSWSNLENLGLHLIFNQRLISDQVTASGGGYMEFIEMGEEPFIAGIREEEGERKAYNRPVSFSSEVLSSAEVDQLLKGTGLEALSSSGGGYKSWLTPLLYLGLILLIGECFFIKRSKKRKEVRDV